MILLTMENQDPFEALSLCRPTNADGTPRYGETAEVPGVGLFKYCYTALTTLIRGSVAATDLDTGDTAGQNPRAVLPASSAVELEHGICAEARTAAGGIWVQTEGRTPVACIDGATNVGVNDPLKAVNGTHYLLIDHSDTGTASFCAVSECVETDTVAAQGNATYGDPTGLTGGSALAPHWVYLPGRRATVA